MQEVWRPVPEYEGWYSISNLGRVRRECAGASRAVVGRILKGSPAMYGYWRVKLSREGAKRRFLLHRLVLAAFVGPAPEGFEANHRNGRKRDNRLVNLEWATRSDNQLHAIGAGLAVLTGNPMGENRKLTDEQILSIRELAAEGIPHREIARRFGVSRPYVCNVIHRRRR